MAKTDKSGPTALASLKPDPKNARRHNPRNIGVISDGLKMVGAARSIVIDENDVVLAGNGVVEAAGKAGIKNVHVVDADGSTLIAVRRSGLTKKQKVQLAVLDNRTNELSAFDGDALNDLADEVGIDLGTIGFTEGELSGMPRFGEEEPDTDSETRGLGLGKNNKLPVVKVAIAVDSLVQVEQAISATGKQNRGEALAEICRFYLEKGQLNFLAEIGAPPAGA